MSLPKTMIARRLRAFLPIALAYLLAMNGVLGGFGSASGASIAVDQGSPLVNIICAAAAAASDNGGDFSAPGKAHTHVAHHCVLCGVSSHGTAPDQSTFLLVFVLLPERSPGAACHSYRSNEPSPFNSGFMSSRTTRAPPLTI